MVTIYNNFRRNNTVNMLQSIIFWDNAHYTQNDNYALLASALSKKVETHPIIKRKALRRGKQGSLMC